MEFKKGDRVRITGYPNAWSSAFGSCPVGIAYPIDVTIKNIRQEGDVCPYIGMSANGYGFDLTALIEKKYISKINNKTIMNKLNSMLKRLLDKDAQALYKVGFLNGDLELTEAGKKELDGIAFETYKAELVKKAEEIIAEEKEEKK